MKSYSLNTAVNLAAVPLFSMALVMSNANGQTLTNNLGGTIISNATNYDLSKPIVCVVESSNHDHTLVAIPPGGQGVLPAQNPDSAALRMDGCSTDDTYLGWIYSVTNPPNTTPPGTMTGFGWNSMSTNQSGVMTGNIFFTPVGSTTQSDIDAITPPTGMSRNLPYIGINLSGAEFANVIKPYSIPDLSTATASTPRSDLVSMKQYVPTGTNTVRLPISWGYLELLDKNSTLANPQWIFNTAYWDNFLLPAITTLTKAKVNTIIDLHTYLHYPLYGTQYSGCSDKTTMCPDGTLDLNPEHYKTAWRDIVTKLRAAGIDENYIMLDLVNEPAANEAATPKETLTPQQAFDVQIPLVVYLQGSAIGFTGKILVEGSYWTGLHSWNEDHTGNNTPTNAAVFTRQNMLDQGVNFGPNNDRVIINVHQYFDADYSGLGTSCQSNLNTVGPNQFNVQAFADWLKEQGLKAMVTELNTPYSNNYNPNCQQLLASFADYLVANKPVNNGGGFIGATLWGGGRGWGTSYNLYLNPTSYQYTTFMNHMTGNGAARR